MYYDVYKKIIIIFPFFGVIKKTTINFAKLFWENENWTFFCPFLYFTEKF